MTTAELQALLAAELTQADEEGRDTAQFRGQIDSLDLDELPAERLERLLDETVGLPQLETFAYSEPDRLLEIQAARPQDQPGELHVRGDFEDSVLGAWLGRCAGCLLGKPVEGWPHAAIVEYLRSADEYPLAQYFPWLEPNPVEQALHRTARESTRGGITGMPRDDDLDYPILGLHVLEQHGPEFTTDDVADAWLSRLPYHVVYTAERAAYRNLVDGLLPPETARHRNPYREWIGAQIRADIFGYVSPGRPHRAAELAYKDAVLSHTKNGVYGEMWAAAMVAAAFTSDSPAEAIRAGLTQIPTSSRLYHAISQTLEWHGTYPDWKQAWERVMQAYGHYHGVHTINNACFVVLGLMYGDTNFGRSIGIAVECGMDSDCNGATAGSVLGAMLGARALPSQWVEPLNNRVRSAVLGYERTSISDLAARTVEISSTA